MARAACRELGITLLETNVDSTSGVLDAVNSLAARGVQALWVGGDNVMMSATDTALLATSRARIPAFTITPGRPDRGTTLDVGLDFLEVGRLAGALAADVLRGANPATIPIRNVVEIVPRRLIVNTWRCEACEIPGAPGRRAEEGDHHRRRRGIHTRGESSSAKD